MTPETAETKIEDVIKKIRAQLDSAAALAKQAEACVADGNTGAALTIVFEAALPIYEATTFLNAASLMRAETKPE
jgi:fatty acid/phospholipid biosynthesis enzyme